MPTFAELVENLDLLSNEEMKEMKEIIERKWMSIKQQEIIDAVEEARKESKEGKTLVLSTPEEIKTYFEKLIADGN